VPTIVASWAREIELSIVPRNKRRNANRRSNLFILIKG
jgi:hypothetical protein